MPINAPYSGGFSPGAQLPAVDGDFEVCDPAGLPGIAFPLKGDSALSVRDVLYLRNDGPSGWTYDPIPLGTFPNIQPWSPNQAAMLLEQEFMVAQSAYLPMALNTPYNPAWAIGWQGQTTTGYPLPALNQLYLVTEGDLQDMGAGICKLKRTFASLPATRNEIEQYAYTFPGFGGGRFPTTLTVQSRLQYDYFIFDDLDLLTIPLFPAGNRLDSSSGLSPSSLILQPFFYFRDQTGVATNDFLTPATLSGDGTQATDTVPSLTGFQNAIAGTGTSNGLAAELIVEGSTMTRWMGNIFERRTRFVIAQ